MQSRTAVGQITSRASLGVQEDVESQTVQDRESLIPRCRSGVPVPWDMLKPQGASLGQ